MPELPEIHTIVEDLKRYVTGAVVKDVKFVNGYSPQNDIQYFMEYTKGATITEVRRVAKNIVIKLSSDAYLTIHLAMTGKLLLRQPDYKRDPYERMLIIAEKNGKDFELRFCDMRMFGKVTLYDETNVHHLQNKYGPEPHDKDLTPQKFHFKIQSKKTNIKNVLLDQSVIAGLGNVYATDALFIAGINPQKNTKEITLKDAENLLCAARTILAEGIKNRGISMRDYVDLLGKKGSQQNHFRIYQKEICTVCGDKVAFLTLNSRGTYYCPTCQPS